MDRSKLIEALQTSLNYRFQDSSLLEQALTHRSARKKMKVGDYEQLEFLGDAVVDLAVAHILLNEYPKDQEGELSKMRAALVNTESLAGIARELDLGPLIHFSSGEESSGGAEKNSILADVVEALIGVIYLESGYDEAFKVVEKLFAHRSQTVTPKDPKTELQEILHASNLPAPEYLLENSEGPDHAPIFVSVVEIGGQVRGRGRGTSKKASQQAAALEALKSLKED